MFHEFLIQGFTFCTVILILQYVFHKPYRKTYLQLARTANRLLWFWSFLTLLFTFVGVVAVGTLVFTLGNKDYIDRYDLPELSIMLFFPLGAIFFTLFFKVSRRFPLLTMCAFSVLLSFSRIDYGNYFSWISPLYGLLFWAMLVAVRHFFEWLKKSIEARDNETLPERI